MTETSPTPERWFWPALVVLALLAALTRIVPVADYDTPWHLYNGQRALEHMWMRWPDQTSFTVPGREYISYPWLGDVIMVGVHAIGGWTGLILLSAACAAASTILVGLVARRAAGPRVWLALGVTALATGATAYTFETRPQALFMVLMPLALLWSDDFAEAREPRRVRIAALKLAGLQLLWCHVHASFILVPAVAGAALFDVFTREGLIPFLRRLWLPVLLALLTLLGPGGLHYYELLFAISGQDGVRHIGEMKALTLSDLLPRFANSILWIDLLLLLGVIRALWNRKTTVADVVRVLAGLMLVFTARRLRAPWAVMSVPFAARLHGAAPLTGVPAKVERMLAIAAIALVVPVNATTASKRDPARGAGFGLHRDQLAYHSAEAIAAAGFSGDVLNDYKDGGYLTFRLGPAVRIAIDGRTPTLFDDELYFLLRRALSDPHAFRVVDQRWAPGMVLIPRQAPLCAQLAANPAFRAAYLDHERTLFVRSGAADRLPGLVHVSPCSPESSAAQVCAAGPETFAAALRELEGLAAVVPEAWFPIYLRAQLLLACGDAGEQLRADVAALLARTTEPRATFVAARGVATLGGRKEAFALVSGLVEHLGVDARLLRARIAASLGDWPAVVADLRQVAFELDDLTPPAVRLDLARALDATGDRAAAVREARRAFWVSGGEDARALLRELGVEEPSP